MGEGKITSERRTKKGEDERAKGRGVCGVEPEMMSNSELRRK